MSSCTGSFRLERCRHALIVSTGRCGSTLLSRLLSLHPDVLSLSEFFSSLGGPRALPHCAVDGPRVAAILASVDPDLRDVLENCEVPEVPVAPDEALLAPDDGARPKALCGPLLVSFPQLCGGPEALLSDAISLCADQPERPAGEHWRMLFDWLCARLERRIWVERSGGSIEYATALMHTFPEAAFVHLVRDGRACALSMSRHPMFRLRVARLHLRRPDLHAAQCLATTIPLHRFGAYWSSLMLETWKVVARQRAAAIPHLVVRYEALLQQPEQALARLSELLGCRKLDREWLSRATAELRPPTSSWLQLPPAERDPLERACRPGMRVVARLTAATI